MGGATMFTYACISSSSVLSQISGFIGEAPDFGFPADAPAKPHRLTVVAGKIAKNLMRRRCPELWKSRKNTWTTLCVMIL
jgi:hypothetical protein